MRSSFRNGNVSVGRRCSGSDRISIGSGRSRPAQVSRIPADHILIGSTHTHSAPDCYAFPDGKGGHTGDLEVYGLCLQSSRRGIE